MTIDKKMIYDKDLFNAGVWKSKDLFDANDAIIPFNELKKRGVTTKSYMTWRSLVQKVKELHRHQDNITEKIFTDLTFELNNGEIIDILKSNSREMYQKIILKKDITTKVMSKYAALYDIPTNAWPNIYTLYRRCTNDATIKELQFKILHGYIPTNKLLFQMSKVVSNKCSFCEMYIETVEHVFYSCSVIRNIWLEIERKLHIAENEKINLTVSDVLFCYNMASKDTFSVQNRNVNTVVIYGKSLLKCKAKCCDPMSDIPPVAQKFSRLFY